VNYGKKSCIYVLAGTNGAGKSSVAGAMLLAAGAEFFNPDIAARRILSENPTATQTEANSAAWHEGKRLLERAIDEGLNYAFETTLGGNTIPAILKSASSTGHEVRVLFVGLSSPELHIARVRARVAIGGHDIPEEKIRERYDRSRENLIELMPGLTEFRLYDNSQDGDPGSELAPEPFLVLHLKQRQIVAACDPRDVPAWAKPVVVAAMKLSGTGTL
jgi:predicted ABC-type ATPase